MAPSKRVAKMLEEYKFARCRVGLPAFGVPADDWRKAQSCDIAIVERTERALSALTPTERQVLEARFVERKRQAEVAHELGDMPKSSFCDLQRRAATRFLLAFGEEVTYDNDSVKNRQDGGSTCK